MKILILGSGGHGKVIADILLQQNVAVQGFLDDAPNKVDTYVMGIPILGTIDQYAQFSPTGMAIGIGDNRIRQQIVTRLGEQAQALWINVIHPTALISPTAQLGTGIVLCAYAVANTDSKIGHHTIINTAATVDHDCQVGDFSHLSAGVHLGGGTHIGNGVLVGIGGVTLPTRHIGDWAVIGAGATVVHDVPPHVTAIGSPARWAS